MIFKEVIAKIKKSNKFFGSLNRQFELQKHMSADILAYAQLASLLDGRYIPITEYSLRPYTIAHILNDILINNRKIVVEFGSGISTILILALIAKYKLEAKLISFDHDDGWQKALTKMYLSNTQNELELIHAPLMKTINGIKKEQSWYDEQIINDRLRSVSVDLLIIDGPPGGEMNEYARYPATKIVEKYLSANGSVLVDDISRMHEKRIVKDLEKMGFKANWSLRHCMLSKVEGFNTNPFGKALY